MQPPLSPNRYTFTATVYLAAIILTLVVSATNATDCNCDSLEGSHEAGREVCGVDGMKYASDCLAVCQGVAVSSAEGLACEPAFGLVQGGQPGELLDLAVLNQFGDQGMRYLGERTEESDIHRPRIRGLQVVDLLLAGEGGVYGRPETLDMSTAGKGLDERKEDSRKAMNSRRHLSFVAEFLEYKAIYEDNLKDDRIPVEDTEVAPYRRIGLVEPSGCTGVMVGPDKVLTAAHCLPTIERIGFAPAKYHGGRPYGTLPSKYFRVRSCFSDQDEKGCDIAVVALTQSVGIETGWFDIIGWCSPGAVNLTIAGYPGDKKPRDMWYEACEEAYMECPEGPGILKHTCDVAAGMSGSPLWDEEGYIRAVHSGLSGTEGVVAAQITPETYSAVQAWIDE